jgi:hypothetical protein
MLSGKGIRPMWRVVILLASVVLVAVLGCEESITPIIVEPSRTVTDSAVVPLGGSVDITDGIRNFRSVHVVGTLTYYTTFFDDLARSEEGSSKGRVGVFLHVQFQFQRINDYQGVSQNWHAGGKSYDVLDLREDGSALVHKQYQLWGITNIAFVNVEFLILRSDVRIHNIWISYEYPE